MTNLYHMLVRVTMETGANEFSVEKIKYNRPFCGDHGDDVACDEMAFDTSAVKVEKSTFAAACP